jgi:hypothetical protein
LETQGFAQKLKALPKKLKAVLDADAFIQKWDFKGVRPLMGAGQSPAGLQGQRSWASLWLK